MNIKWFSIRETKTEKSAVRITDLIAFDKKLKVEISDKDGNKRENWTHFDYDNDVIRVTMMFDKENPSLWKENEASEIEYNLRNNGCWKINNDSQQVEINEGKEQEFEKELKNAHVNLLKEKFADEINVNIKKDVEDSENIQYTMQTIDNDELSISIYKKDDAKNAGRTFKGDRIKVEADFYPKKRANFLKTIKKVTVSPPKEESFWNSTIFIALIIILLITSGVAFIFRERILRWIKGESKQEKKVREQIDIF